MGYGRTLHCRGDIVSDLIWVEDGYPNRLMDRHQGVIVRRATVVPLLLAARAPGRWHSQAKPLFCCQDSFQMFPWLLSLLTFIPVWNILALIFFYPLSSSLVTIRMLTRVLPDSSASPWLFIPPFSKSARRKATERVAADTRIIAPLTYFYRLSRRSVAAVHSGYLICIFAKSLADGTRAWRDSGRLIPTQLTQTHTYNPSRHHTQSHPPLWGRSCVSSLGRPP